MVLSKEQNNQEVSYKKYHVIIPEDICAIRQEFDILLIDDLVEIFRKSGCIGRTW